MDFILKQIFFEKKNATPGKTVPTCRDLANPTVMVIQ
jgi:hypothetical protein